LRTQPPGARTTKAQIGIAKGGQEFSVYGVPLLPQGLDAAWCCIVHLQRNQRRAK